MPKDEKYAGTKGLDVNIAFNRVFELMDKQPLSPKDEEFYKEAKDYIKNNIEALRNKAGRWDKCKESLTAKQLLKVIEE